VTYRGEKSRNGVCGASHEGYVRFSNHPPATTTTRIDRIIIIIGIMSIHYSVVGKIVIIHVPEQVLVFVVRLAKAFHTNRHHTLERGVWETLAQKI
jgi:hypothetical protein